MDLFRCTPEYLLVIAQRAEGRTRTSLLRLLAGKLDGYVVLEVDAVGELFDELVLVGGLG